MAKPRKKRGPGRPYLGNKGRVRRFEVRLNSDEEKRWTALADKQKISLSELVRESVEMAIARGSSQ